MKNVIKGALVASAVAGLMVTVGCGTPTDTNQDALGKCWGANDCKGLGDCASKDGSHDCAGKGDCKTQSWKKMKKADCDAVKDATWEEIKG